jgi:predicted nucleotidyltransferase
MIEGHLKLFASLNEKRVEYLLIGGTLAIAYGVPRHTKDIDIFLRPTQENAQRCLDALKELGLATAGLTTPEEICENEITIFKDVVRLDVLTQVKGIEFGEAWRNRVYLSLDDVDIPSLSLNDLIATKKAADRPSDKEDIKILELAKSER